MSLELLLGPQLDAFLAAGYDVHVASAPGEFVPAIEARGVRFHALEHSTRSFDPLADIRAAREVYQLFRDLQPDIVHTHNPKPGIYGRIGARLARTPAIVNTVHGLYAQASDRWLRRAVVYGLERLAASFSHAELVQNPEDLRTLAGLGVPTSRLRLLGNGVDLTRFRPGTPTERCEVRSWLGLTETDMVIGAVGRLVAEKGYPELLEAFSKVRDRVPTARLVVVGPHEPGKSDALTEQQVAQATVQGVTFLGHRDDVEKIYRALDVYVLASHREGFPRSAMEAGASAIPLVLTDIRGCRQVVTNGQNGLLVPPRDPTGLARALTELLDDPDRRAAMGRAGLRRAHDDFDQLKVIETTLETYDELLADRGRSHGYGRD